MATISLNIQSLVSTLFCSPLTGGPAIRKVKKKILLFSLYSSLTCMFPGFEGTLCPFHERLKTKFRRFALWFIFINQLQGSIVVTILQVAVDIFKNMIPLFLIFFLCLLCGGFWKTYGPIILFTTTIYNALFSRIHIQAVARAGREATVLDWVGGTPSVTLTRRKKVILSFRPAF